MTDTAGTEFWRDIKPIATVFKPEAVPEAYVSNAPTDDERHYVPLTETVGTRPLSISPTENRWRDILRSTGAGLVDRHYHPQQVFAYTISGKWGCLEHDWVATPATSYTKRRGRRTRLSPTSQTSRCLCTSTSRGR
jgi:2,4'-dihydroxyacetophenone dioxygenase